MKWELAPPASKYVVRNAIIIGDVHGCYDELTELLHLYAFDRDLICYVGDLVDKGPDSTRVAETAMLMRSLCVLGNHEELHIRYEKHENQRMITGKKNPMQRDDRFKQTHEALEDSSLDVFTWMENLPTHILLETFNPTEQLIVLHGGLLPGKTPEEMSRKKICRVRNVHPSGKFASLQECTKNSDLPFWTDLYSGDVPIAYGHAGFDEVREQQNDIGARTFGLDTGCVYGNKLSALLFPEMKIVSVSARAIYARCHEEE
jgi:hypothetical protein